MKKMGLLIFMFTSFVAYGREALYVQSLKAKVFQEPKLGSAEVATLQKGDKVYSKGKVDGWYRIEYLKIEGWVPSMLLGKEPPLERVSLTEKEVDIKDTARRRASGYTTAAAVRGLLEDRYRVNQKYMLDLESVRWLENLKIKKEDISKFEQEGR